MRVALKRIARVKHIQRTLTDQWSVLATLTPDGVQRSSAASSATRRGFQSVQYRAVEFMLGNKHRGMLKVHEADPAAHAHRSKSCSRRRASTTSSCATSHDVGMPCPQEILDRDVSVAHVPNAGLVKVLTGIYEDAENHWDIYEACEELVDLEDNFQLWRFRHLKTVAARHRHEDRDRRLERRRIPPARARAHLLPGTVLGPHRDRHDPLLTQLLLPMRAP